MGAANQNFDSNANVAYLVYIPTAVFVVICPTLVALRFWTRLKHGGKIGADDYMTLIALMSTLLTCGFLFGSCQHGMGRHFATISDQEKIPTLKYFFMAQVTYKAAINLTKCCILLLYLRIFSIVRWFRMSCWAMLTIVAMYCAASVLVTIFQCNPISRAFNKAMPGTCMNNTKFWYANAGFSIATDIIILLLPMPLVYKLDVPRFQKIALMAVFAIGIFVVITSCLRITSLDILATSPDMTYDIANVMWTIIEPNLAVVCACLPILRPLVVKIFPALRSKGYSNKYASGQASKSRATAGSHHARSRNDWVAIEDSKSDGIHMASIQRSGSTAGSDETILGEARQSDGNGAGIQKTVEYTVEYSNKRS
ncbi:hypothetical protein QQS21_000825 [Conoideocrella luteorostrata]|uniref:Rhodopsin domain-containing protein n=1 Tax=Conoideocrella luteorostrata TaxID=1105319 RepID=A0AAJ0G3R9_9HYPO|nr:hypothetical protein QQS21_000825 [Conoideocrella luteorostrata]